jgi:hypothetical protein
MTPDQIGKLTDSMVDDIKSIQLNSLKMVWYMRGGVSYTDVMNMSANELNAINQVVDDNMETTKKTKLPFF